MKSDNLPKNRIGRVPIRKLNDPRYAKKPYELSVRVQRKRKRTYYSSYEAAERAWKKHKRIEIRYGNSALEYDKNAHIEYSQAKQIVGADISLVDVAKFWKIHCSGLKEAPSLKEAVELFLAQKLQLGRSKHHHRDLSSRLGTFTESFIGKKLPEITGNQLLRWMVNLNYEPRTIHNYHAVLCNFFGWCERRNWIRQSPTQTIREDDLPTIPKKPKGVLTVDQSAAMFQWLEKYRPHFVAWFALQAFAGIRRAETDRFQWEWVDYKRKRIILPGWFFSFNEKPQQGTKTQDDWVLQNLPSNLWLWLERHAHHQGKIRYPADSILTTIRKTFQSLPDFPIHPWPNNALRHTFCTMHISLYESADKTALLLRHQNTRQLYQNYLAKIVPMEDAKRYFDIRPKL